MAAELPEIQQDRLACARVRRKRLGILGFARGRRWCEAKQPNYPSQRRIWVGKVLQRFDTSGTPYAASRGDAVWRQGGHTQEDRRM